MATLFLYHVKRTDRYSYGEYSNFVVCAEQEAQETHPDGSSCWNEESQNWRLKSRDGPEGYWSTWPDKMESIRVKLLGTPLPNQEKGVICKSFHPG